MIETISDLVRQFRLYIHEILYFTLFLMEEQTLMFSYQGRTEGEGGNEYFFYLCLLCCKSYLDYFD